MEWQQHRTQHSMLSVRVVYALRISTQHMQRSMLLLLLQMVLSCSQQHL